MFQHYIITRFNLRRADWTTTKNGEEVLSDSWLKERFELFDNYCFSSVSKQTNQNFKWLVFFDNQTPEKYKGVIKEYQLSYSNFLPFFIDGMDSFLPAIIEKVNELDEKNYIITSRMDNDDCIHKDYVNTVQKEFDNQDFMAIDLVDGYRMQVGKHVRLGKMRNMFNPYISLIERKDNFKTVWSNGHTHWKYEYRVLGVKTSRMWMTIIHEKNKANTFKGFGSVKMNVLNDFNIKESKLVELKSNFEDHAIWRMRSMKNQYKVMTAYYGKKLKRATGIYKIKARSAKNDFD